MRENVPDFGDLRLRYYPDPLLRRPAESVEDIDEVVVKLAERMIELMVREQGIGLAASQLGVPVRIIVVSLSGQAEDAEAFINPELSNFQGWTEVEEGCLSIPGVRAKVRRPAACTVQAHDLDGNRFELDAVDLAATVFQHETDHLNGTLFIDRIGAVSRLGCRKALKQLELEYEGG